MGRTQYGEINEKLENIRKASTPPMRGPSKFFNSPLTNL